MDFIKSLRYALTGLLDILKTQRNARIHLITAILVFSAGILLGLSSGELAGIFFAIIFVFLAEIINTAFEKTLNLIDPGYRPEIKLIKDMAAGAVLVSSIGAVIIGVAIFWPYILGLIWHR